MGWTEAKKAPLRETGLQSKPQIIYIQLSWLCVGGSGAGEGSSLSKTTTETNQQELLYKEYKISIFNLFKK